MVWVAIGGVIGSLFRYLLNEVIGSDNNGVLVANLVGISVAVIAIEYCKIDQRTSVRNFLVPGFCGGLTTFSSAMLLSEQTGYAYLFETVGLSFLTIAFFVPIARRMFRVKS